MPFRFRIGGELSPNQEDLASALSGLLACAGVRQEPNCVNISAVAGVRHPAYHLLTPDNYTEAVSEILSAALSRPFPSDHSGWLIDGREARTLIEAAHEALMARRE